MYYSGQEKNQSTVLLVRVKKVLTAGGQIRRKNGELSSVPLITQLLRGAKHASMEETLESTELYNPRAIWNEEECTGEPQESYIPRNSQFI